MRTYSFGFRVTTWAVITLFAWSYGPLFQLPMALAAEKQKTAAKEQAPRPVNREQRPEEKFEGVLTGLREEVNKAGEKNAKGEDDSAELQAVKIKKTEIEAIDLELKKEFDATGQRLKAAKLPKEIFARHTAFVEHYTSNVNSLRKELDDIDKAKTTTDRKAKIEKVRLHLEGVTPKRKSVPLDPRHLPFSTRKATKTVSPRLRKEDFEKDFPKHKSQDKQKIADSRLLPDLPSSKPQPKPVLLAFNETAGDMPFSLGAQNITPQFAFVDSSPIILAQATVQPGPEDLAETPDITFSPAIRAKAQELGGSPVRIYEWVRSNIEYAPTYGSISGADQCLQSRICNDMDTASLLIALFRVSGIYAHYVYSTIEIPIDKAMNLVGGVTNPNMVATIFATNGVPVRNVISGGTIKAVQIERVTVSAFIDYIPSRGAVHRQGNTWIPLDASYKSYTYTQGIDIASAVPFDAQTFANQLQSSATISTDGSVTNVNSLLVQQTMQDYQTQVQNYIQQNYPNATVGDVIGKKEIIKQEFGILPETLPYKTIQVGSRFSQVPDNLRESMSFSIPDPTGASAGLSYITGMPQIAGKKITLSFSPATATDQVVIESLFPRPHADGTPIQPSELPSSFPAYLINLKPELRIEGQVVTTGSSATMGSAQSFTMSLNEPGIGLSNIDNIVKAGEYYGIGVDTGRADAKLLQNLMTKLEATKAKLKMQNSVGLTKDDVVGDLLFTTITAYFQALDDSDEVAAKTQSIIHYRVPSVGMYSVQLGVQEIFGIPKSASFAGMMMDVDRIMQAVFSKDGSMARVKQYMLASGSVSSALEHLVPEKMYSKPNNAVQGISATKALGIANSQGIPIYTISQANVATVLPQLQVGDNVKSDIANAVNAGKQVTVSKSNVTYNGWTGCGYVILDSVTGAGAYMISGGQSGAFIALLLTVLFFPLFPMILLLVPYLAFDWEPIAICNTTWETCFSTCMNTLNPFWLSNEAGAIVGLLNMAELSLWGSSITASMTALSAFLAAPVAVSSGVLGSWVGGSGIGCSLVCASNSCYYQ